MEKIERMLNSLCSELKLGNEQLYICEIAIIELKIINVSMASSRLVENSSQLNRMTSIIPKVVFPEVISTYTTHLVTIRGVTRKCWAGRIEKAGRAGKVVGGSSLDPHCCEGPPFNPTLYWGI